MASPRQQVFPGLRSGSANKLDNCRPGPFAAATLPELSPVNGSTSPTETRIVLSAALFHQARRLGRPARCAPTHPNIVGGLTTWQPKCMPARELTDRHTCDWVPQGTKS